MVQQEWIEEKRKHIQEKYENWHISESHYKKLMAAIEKKTKQSLWSSILSHVKTIKAFHQKWKELEKPNEYSHQTARLIEKWLISKNEISNYKINYKKKKLPKKYYIFLWVAVVLVLRYYLCYMPKKTYIEVEDFSSLWDPIQTPITWEADKLINGSNIHISYLAEYDIKWRVLVTAQYWDNIIQRLLDSNYLTDNIVWWGRGFMAEDDIVKRFKRKSYYRAMFPEYKSMKDYNYVREKYSDTDIQTHISHNHLIPADDHVKKLIRWIKKWDYIQIKWYLVSITSDKWYALQSSLVRDDTGDGACETIYVTDILWLKER